jgi:hypothetical protein
LQSSDISVNGSGDESSSSSPKEPPLYMKVLFLKDCCFLILSLLLHYKSIEEISDVSKETKRLLGIWSSVAGTSASDVPRFFSSHNDSTETANPRSAFNITLPIHSGILCAWLNLA